MGAGLRPPVITVYTRVAPSFSRRNSMFDRHNLSLHGEEDAFDKSLLLHSSLLGWFMRLGESRGRRDTHEPMVSLVDNVD